MSDVKGLIKRALDVSKLIYVSHLIGQSVEWKIMHNVLMDLTLTSGITESESLYDL